MNTAIQEIIARLSDPAGLGTKQFAQLIYRYNKNLPTEEHLSKKKLLAYVLEQKRANSALWQSWNLDQPTEKTLLAALQMKPRRTASGVATITVMTKPWRCSSNCSYCPNDVRMPKSYLSDEPVCQRAERNYFDPYLQVAARLGVLTQMGHPTDKVELIVLGGTWSDYPQEYQIWFIHELFRALNEADSEQFAAEVAARRAFYEQCGLTYDKDVIRAQTGAVQQEVYEGKRTFNNAIELLYKKNDAWQQASAAQTITLDGVLDQHHINETTHHRVVGLVIETRPEMATPRNLTLLRRLGCTKVQMGVQSLNPSVLATNNRTTSLDTIQRAFELLRLFGFKIHAHFMVNLEGATPASDKEDYRCFAQDTPYQPDEIKLYPCALVQGTALCEHYKQGLWAPYSEEELIDVLVCDLQNTRPFTRVSRMIRDISAHDIMAGNKKANLRQLVEDKLKANNSAVEEIRFREINNREVAQDELELKTYTYQTTATTEHFSQWVTPNNEIAGFLRLSLPLSSAHERFGEDLPVARDEAMIREIHVYGKAAKLHASSSGAQHKGLGKQLIAQACNLARAEGYRALNVISSVGTREYYRAQGFVDGDLYQQKPL